MKQRMDYFLVWLVWMFSINLWLMSDPWDLGSVGKATPSRNGPALEESVMNVGVAVHDV